MIKLAGFAILLLLAFFGLMQLLHIFLHPAPCPEPDARLHRHVLKVVKVAHETRAEQQLTMLLLACDCQDPLVIESRWLFGHWEMGDLNGGCDRELGELRRMSGLEAKL